MLRQVAECAETGGCHIGQMIGAEDFEAEPPRRIIVRKQRGRWSGFNPPAVWFWDLG